MEPGYSTRIDTPEFKEAMDKGNRTFVVTVVLTALFLPPLVAGIAALISREQLPIVVAACAIVWVITIAIVAWLLGKRFLGKSWDGVVDSQDVGSERSGSGHRRQRVYITRFVTDSGRKVTYKERTLHPFYDYLTFGDRVRYHPRLSYPFEKYDKTADETVICPFCGRMSSIELTECSSCHKPLLV